ncbi:MAG: hypothetical protein K8R34_14120 [Methanosarcinales archaeon]|nr:hypothetical protein [Methanosarcinales archaeon]
MQKLSPAMRQYYDAKQQHPDALIMFRMGDFYESFGEDAATMASELDITLTTRGKDKDGEKMLSVAACFSGSPPGKAAHKVAHGLVGLQILRHLCQRKG